MEVVKSSIRYEENVVLTMPNAVLIDHYKAQYISNTYSNLDIFLFCKLLFTLVSKKLKRKIKTLVLQKYSTVIS